VSPTLDARYEEWRSHDEPEPDAESEAPEAGPDQQPTGRGRIVLYALAGVLVLVAASRLGEACGV